MLNDVLSHTSSVLPHWETDPRMVVFERALRRRDVSAPGTCAAMLLAPTGDRFNFR